MSGRDRKGRWRVGPHLKVVNIMGGSDLDLNDAELADDVVEITVFALMGGADIRVPEGLNVEVSDFAFMGGNDAPARRRAARSRRPDAAPADDLDHGRHRRQARPQAQPRRAQGAQAPRARELSRGRAPAPAGRAAR